MLEYLQSLESETVTEQELLDLYSKDIRIEFNGHIYTTPFDAVSYNALIELIKIVEEQK